MWLSSCCGLVIVLLCLVNVAHIQAQCQRPSIDGNRVLAEGTYEESYAYEVTLTLKCATGYVTVNPSASRTITCLGSMWSTLELQCKKRSCGSPDEILNGEYLLTNGVEFGSIATVKCNNGYTPAGQITIRRCLASGVWDGRPPLCEAVRCPKPPSIANGQIDSNEEVYTYNQAVTYSCVGGTFLFGARTLTCSADGTFKPDPPQCTSVRCPAVRLTNGFRTGGKFAQSYELREFLQFECDKGYVMKGSDYIVCQQNGWEPTPPTCRHEACPRVRVKNGYRTAGQSNPPYESGYYLDFKCNEGFRMEGDGHIVCRENGWEPPPPTCVDVTSPDPLQPTHLPLLIVILITQLILGMAIFTLFCKKRSQ